MQENPFDIDQSAADRLNQGMDLGGGIRLPFEAPVFWWMNGNPQMRALAPQFPALYYGGWSASEESVEAVLDARQGMLPGGMIKTDVTTKESKTIPSYTIRLMIVAPIGFRSCWAVGDNGTKIRSVKFVQGGRQHIQLLGMAGMRLQSGQYQAWGPVVLSAKGYQAQYLQSALKDWKKLMERPRKQYAPQVPAWAFWSAIGTYGEKIDSRMVGKAGAQSPVTPINLWTPTGEIDRSLLIKLFVGKDTVSEMAQLQEEASEWLNAWKNQGTAGPSGAPEDDGYFPEEEPGEDIPF